MAKRAQPKDFDAFIDQVLNPDDLPNLEQLRKDFKSKSAAIRYLFLEKGLTVKRIATYLNLEYRHVYKVVREAQNAQTPEHICPVCKNRKG